MLRSCVAGTGLALLLAAGGSQAAAADSDGIMKVLYENTLTCQGGVTDNWLCYVWYYPGGYVREFQVLRRRDGNMALSGREGTYSVDSVGGKPTLCQTFDSGQHTWCRELAAHQIGERWQETLADGSAQTFSLLKGRLLLNFLTGNGTDPHTLTPYKYPDYPPDPSRIMRDIGGAASR